MPWTNGESRRSVSSGAWEVEIVDGSFDHVRYEGVEILRAVRLVVRDHDWRTVPARVDAITVDEATHAATVVELRGQFDDLGVRASWRSTLRLGSQTLDVEAEVVARSAFRRNRIGLVILHPTDVAGAPLDVEHPDASVTRARFPVGIAPHQPAVEIASLRWESGGLGIALRVDGDVFEMEDQRNWTDASFKTYSTPLSRPFPVEVEPGDRVRQTAHVDVSGSATTSTDGRAAAREGLRAASRVVPRIGVGAATAPGEAPTSRPLPDGVGVLVELDLRDPGWTRALARARRDAAGGPLDVRLISDSPDALDTALAALCGVPLCRIGVYDSANHVTTEPLWRRLVDAAAREPVLGALVGGTRAHFTELNRNHGDLPADLPAVTFSVTPQMHDVSTDQVVESIEVQRLVATEAGRIAAGRPVHIGPVTLRSRFNAVATSDTLVRAPRVSETGYGPEFVWNATDHRQHTREYASWLLASFVALSVDTVESIAYAEAWGPRGIGDGSEHGGRASTVVRWLAEVAGWEIVDPGPTPAGSAVLAAREADRSVILAANTAARPTTIDLRRLGGGLVAVEPLDVVRVVV